MARGLTESGTAEEKQQYLRYGCLRSFNCGTSSVNCVRFFGDADHVLAGASDRTVYLLGAQYGILHQFAGGQPLRHDLINDTCSIKISCMLNLECKIKLHASPCAISFLPLNGILVFDTRNCRLKTIS